MDPAKIVTAGAEPTPQPDKALPSLTSQGPKQAFMTNSAFFTQADRNGVQADLEHPNDYPAEVGALAQPKKKKKKVKKKKPVPVETYQMPDDDDIGKPKASEPVEPQDINRAPSLGLDLNSAAPLGNLGELAGDNDFDDDFDYDDVQVQKQDKSAAKRQQSIDSDFF